MKKKLLLGAFLVALLLFSACSILPPPPTEEPPDTDPFAWMLPVDLPVPTPTPPEPDIPVAVVSVTLGGKVAEDVTWAVRGAEITLDIPLLYAQSSLKKGEILFTLADGTTVTREMDLTAPQVVSIPTSEGERDCRLTAERDGFGLPILEIETDNAAPVADKNTYIHGRLKIDGQEYPLQIKGRGNASWNHFPKKSYRIKLDKGEKLFGLPQNRDWVLTGNYPDKTLIRNCVAHTLSATLSGIEYTATHIPVHLFLNGEYLGVYTFGDKIENGNGRLDLGEPVYEGEKLSDVGFLIEIGWDFDSENLYNRDYFDTDILRRLFVKDPEIQVALAPEMRIIKNYVLQTEKAIVTDNGWENYIDVESFVDWFILNELTFNTESSFYRSCYLWRPVGGKLKMGPVWDFDMAFGNHRGDLRGYNGWCTTESTYEYITENWMDYLMTYPAFTHRLVARWNEVKEDLLFTALMAVDEYAGRLEGSQQQNFNRWEIMTVGVGMGAVNPYQYNTYEKQVQYLRDFITTRYAYMDARLNSAEYN